MDLTLYWFMLPVSTLVATTAMLSGIGGAALFTPIFLIIFPILGPAYPLESAVAAISVALLTETFGFSSGFVGYYRKRLIDFRSAVPFLLVGVPVAIAGALAARFVDQDFLKGCYAVLMVALSVILIRHKEHAEEVAPQVDASLGAADAREMRTITARDGKTYTYRVPRQGLGAIFTGIGGFLTGMLSVGIGEVIMPQLVRRKVPVPVAAATSVLTVIVVVASASFTQISALIAAGGVNAVPWNLVVYTIPGVIIGGQIGPRLQGKIPQVAMIRSIGVLFAVIGMAMLWLVFASGGGVETHV